MVGLELDDRVRVLQFLDIALTDDRAADHVGDNPQNIEFGRAPCSLRRAVVKAYATPNLAVHGYGNHKNSPGSPTSGTGT